jgi:tRNA threonylcarbamoyl adenosine modification protein YeaZ
MKILAFELSSPQGSIAFEGEGQEPFCLNFPNDRKDSGPFFRHLQAFLERFGQPERIAIGLGPGSYAGTRIAIATATGLATANGAQLVGVPSYCAMETEAIEYAVIGDARRRSYFLVQVQQRRALEEPALYSEEELADRLRDIDSPVFTTEALAPFPTAEVRCPSARFLSRIRSEIATQPLEPIYLRTPHITYPKTRPVISDSR